MIRSDPWIRSMDQIHGSDPLIRSMDQIHGSDPWIWSMDRSMDQIHGSDPWIWTESWPESAPISCARLGIIICSSWPRKRPSGAMFVCNRLPSFAPGSIWPMLNLLSPSAGDVLLGAKNKRISLNIHQKLERPTSKLERQHHFFWKSLKTEGFSILCVSAEARAAKFILPALNSARTPKCKHCLGNESASRCQSPSC